MSSDADIEVRAAAWEQAGIVTPEQASRIVAFERAGAPAVGARVSGMLGSIGGLLVGLGVLLTVAANWDSIGDVTKLVTIVVTMLVAYGLALVADQRGAPRWMGTAGYTVGTLVFAGGVFLLGQVFNVQSHDPLGFLYVAIAATAVAVLAERRLVGWIAAAAWLAWAMHEFVLAIGDTSDEEAAVVLCGAALLLAITALGAGWVLDGAAHRARREPSSPQELGLARSLDVIGGPFRSVALVGLLGVLLPISYAWRFDADDTNFAGATGLLVVVLVAALVASVLVVLLGDMRSRRVTGAVLAIAAVLIAVGVLVQSPTIAGVLANLLLVLGGLGLCALGLIEDRRSEYAWGVTWILALIAARYIDVMIELQYGGLGFVGAGLLLLGSAWLVGRSRRIWKEHGA
ncbi:MAG: rane protein [Thermoleophilia bacterium]|nr:rane protein [Thermoleophilia bacterium]MCZ4496048.1 rane protein [Thermoleophilia bacterium]